MVLSFIKKVSDAWSVGDVRTDSVVNIVNADSNDAIFEAAESVADGFVIPRSVISNDENDLREARSVEALIARRQENSQESRFNETRCLSWLADDEEFSILHELAVHGVVIDTAPGFLPSSTSE